ncbi:hypothetical protein CDEST_15184 [Colletotrichum destructivum]|uniref:Uncharacterized protein n=1 Tax=Colletotrichum destructivum TaxID=34406 RepID=A0AAX4J495_9PEZI|nr:hypothetical protein CDEST_15184 [Colletotrichum destructivum]
MWEDQNVHGVWKKWFMEMLAWYKPRDADVKLSRSDRAPTWSWGSLNRQIKFIGLFTRDESKVVSLDVWGAYGVRHVELNGRLLKDEAKVEPGEGERTEDWVTEYLDCKDSLEIEKASEVEYSLLGTVAHEHQALAVGLMVVSHEDGFYRRVGLALFSGMDVWRNVPCCSIKLR